MHDYYLTFPYALFVVCVGATDSAMKGSILPLTEGLSVGLIFLLAGHLRPVLLVYDVALVYEMLTATGATWITGHRYARNSDNILAGIVAGFSLVMTVFCLYKIFTTGGNEIPAAKTE